MHFTFSPVRMESPLVAHVAGDVLQLNDIVLDFGPLPAGALLPRDAIDNPWIAGDVERDNAGLLHVPLILPHGATAPQATLFPEAVVIGNGPIPLPPYQSAEVPDED